MTAAKISARATSPVAGWGGFVPLKFYFATNDAFALAGRLLAPALLNRVRMIEPIFQTDNYQLARKLLDAAVVRQEAISTNVANAETPGFHRLDIAPDFATQLKAQMAAGNFAQTSDSLKPVLAEDPTARSVRPDGNSVEIEHELLAMNRNAVEYDYLSEVVSYNIKQLRVAVTGRSA